MRSSPGYRVAVRISGETDYTRNGVVFASYEEAADYGQDLAGRWADVGQWKVECVDRAPTHRWTATGAQRIADE